MTQRAICIWMTGLSGSGKTTIATALKEILHENRFFCVIIDGDDLRQGVSVGLSFTLQDRAENAFRAAQFAKILVNNNVIALVTLISPTHIIRKMAHDIVGDAFHLVYVNTPIAVCEDRDVKGLYSKARAGLIKDFTGIDSPFEKPLLPETMISTQEKTPKECAGLIYKRIYSYIYENN